jgi:NTE family protein
MLWKREPVDTRKKIALILSGGGARAAYQVGVLQAVADMLPKGAQNPFPILCGTSAGAINAASIAIYAQQFREAVWRMVHVWGNFNVGQVFRTDWPGLTISASHWLAAMSLGGLGKHNPVSLLDRTPLERLLNHSLNFDNIENSIDMGLVHALSITASSISTGNSVAFYQGAPNIESWYRSRHMGVPEKITIQHLMASSAIPFVFAAEKIGSEFYGDGTIRQTAPASPALHLGADKLFVIGVRHLDEDKPERQEQYEYPSMGQIAGQILDSIFLDNIDLDLERMQRINRALEQIPEKHLPGDSRTMRHVDILNISPSQDLYKIAAKHAHYMPRSVRFFLRGIGASADRGSNLVSYILFERSFCRELIHLGYGDTMDRRDEVLEFIGDDIPVSNRKS